ncbi:G patch domain-containing protein 4 [Bactrocera tryoni]|uniref:G patch domain-containing protein 4 n=1 Tax=Bactrocera tryoni TaxID=59916 RepID=UPI001A963596|nr:G patch domain-containing protein 4 [Bactrocera tryoni]
MDFARKILNKYGWKEGDGLGKHNNGIVKPLKASMKFDNAGLGSDQAASDFNNHWWERVFNEAAENVDVRTTKNGVSVDLKNKDESVEISTKEYSVKKLKKAKDQSCPSDNRYDNFLQSATLTKSGDEIENPNKIAVADISVKKYKPLTDEELFRACGGRTAHKGARHGLKLSGKLSRIEQQEQELLAKMEEKIKESAKKDLKRKSDLIVAHEKQKKKKNKRCAGHELTDLNLSKEINSLTELKKNKREDSPENSNINADVNVRKTKKTKLVTTDVVPEEVLNVNETTVSGSVNSSQNKRRKENSEDPCITPEKSKKSSKNKRKLKSEDHMVDEHHDNSEVNISNKSESNKTRKKTEMPLNSDK